MDYMFRRWVRLPTVLSLLRPKRGDNAIQIRLYSEDETTLKHYSWLNKSNELNKKMVFPLYDTIFSGEVKTAENKELSKMAENFVAKTITIDRVYLDKVNYPYTTDCYLIEVKENK